MGVQLASELAERGLPAENDKISISAGSVAQPRLADDLVWGAAAIAKVIGRTERQTVHLLEHQKIPASKVGGRWCSSKSKLNKFFGDLIGEVV
jgi:hypothetical protein